MPLALPPASRRAFERLAADGRRVLGARFVALLASSPSDGVLFGEHILAADLDAFGPLAEVWHRDGLSTPLVITPAEFRQSLDAFPIEYQAMLDHHVVIAGANPFAGLRVEPGDLRRACEIQARSHLIHLREGWIEAGGHESSLADLTVRSAPPLRALLANLVRLHDISVEDDQALSDAAARLTGMRGDLIRAVLALDASPAGAAALVPRLPEYLDACEQLFAFIDKWRGR